MTRLCGIDIGTTGVRAAVFSEDGALLADASVGCLHDVPKAGWAEADPEAWWRSLRHVLAEVARVLPLKSITALAVTGQAPTIVLVDDAGAVVRPALLWLDTRANAEAKALGTHAYYLGPKLAWLETHEPAAVARAKWLLQSHAFVAYRLTGEVACDLSTAALAPGLFDLAKLDWADDRGVMPAVARAEAMLGRVTPAAAALTGLAAGTPVAVGGGDFAAATLGAGVTPTIDLLRIGFLF